MFCNNDISLNIIYLLYLDSSHAYVIVFFLFIVYNISLWPEDGQAWSKHVVTAD
jgi:cellulose synthase/poly-beta-1,6-N-acetylglucosamine synthase-like glycosyltransferase